MIKVYYLLLGDRARDFGSLRAKELESPKLKLWRDELMSHIF